MTDYTFTNPAQLTEFLENSPLYVANNSTLWGSGPPRTPLTPFYYEASSNTVNFGYGINLTAASGNNQLQDEINSVLAALPGSVTISDTQWEDIVNGGTTEGSTPAVPLQNIVATLNSYAEENIPSVIQSAADTLTQYVLSNSSYSNNVIYQVENKIAGYNALLPSSQQIVFTNLSVGIQAALEDLQYNTGGKFWGKAAIPNIIQALAQNNIQNVAYELAYNTASSSSDPGYQERTVIDAALALGLQVTVDGNHQITGISGLPTNIDAMIGLLESRVTNPNSYLSGATNSFENSLSAYLDSQHYFVPNQINDTLSGDTNADTFVITSGDGAVTITDFNAAKGDTLRFDGGLTLNNMTGLRDANGNLIITLPSGEQITLSNFFNANTPDADGLYHLNLQLGSGAPAVATIAAFVPPSQDPIPAYIYQAIQAFAGTIMRLPDPIAIDLNHDGQITTTGANAVYFDIDNSGMKEAVSWVGPQDGLLAMDINHNGVIDNGSELITSYAQLAALDTNHDGKIDAQDAAYANLVVWQDKNQDGISQSGELLSVKNDLFLEEIPVAPATTGGTTATIQAAVGPMLMQNLTFSEDQLNTVYGGTAPLNFAALALPELREYMYAASMAQRYETPRLAS